MMDGPGEDALETHMQARGRFILRKPDELNEDRDVGSMLLIFQLQRLLEIEDESLFVGKSQNKSEKINSALFPVEGCQMNRVLKVVFNRTKGMFVAVSELGRACTRRGGGKKCCPGRADGIGGNGGDG
jgi:hypothetical protein